VKPKDLAQAVLWQAVLWQAVLWQAVLWQALSQLAGRGWVRVAMAWTSQETHHLLLVSLIGERRAVPMDWRADHASVWKGRMQRYELVVLGRVVGALTRAVGAHRVMVTAARGWADVQLFALLEELRAGFFIGVKGSPKVLYQGHWRKLNSLRTAYAWRAIPVVTSWLLWLTVKARHRGCL
jgi:hypothetical protein